MWPIYWMNVHNCWAGENHCGDGTYGTVLFGAKWYGTVISTVLGTFVGAISGPATTAMISMQVKQTEQASVQAAFSLVGGLSAMYAPLFYTEHFFDVDATSWRVIRYAFVTYGIYVCTTIM